MFNFLRKQKKKSFDSGWHILFSGSGMPHLDMSDTMNLYEQVGWVHAAAFKIAESVAAIPWKITKDEQPANTNISTILEHPNEFYSWAELIELTQLYLELAGEAYWVIERDNANNIAKIWPTNPQNMGVIPDENHFLLGYVFRSHDKKIVLAPQDVVFFKYPHPSNPYRGASPLEAVALEALGDKEAVEWNYTFFKNAAIPAGILDAGNNILTEEQIEHIRKQWKSKYSQTNAHEVAVLSGGLKYQPLTLSQKEMDFMQSRKLTRDDILGVFGVPPPILGITENVNRANAEAAEYIFMKQTILPRLRRIERKITHSLLSQEGSTFVFDNPVPSDKLTNSQIANTSIKSGFITINEARGLIGLEPLKNGDKLLLTPVEIPTTLSLKKNLRRLKTKTFGDETHQIIWKAFVEKQEKVEKDALKKLKKLFQSWQDELNKHIEGKKAFDLFQWVDIDTWMEQLNSILNDSDWNSVEYGIAFLKETSNIVASFTKLKADPIAVEQIGSRCKKFSKDITEDVANKIEATLQEGFQNGEGVVKLRDRVSQVFSNVKNVRAETIARTETAFGMNYGNLQGYRQVFGDAGTKTWYAELDDRTRTSHMVTHGQTVNIPQDFTLGSGVQTPAPLHSGVPAEDINCRCTVLFNPPD